MDDYEVLKRIGEVLAADRAAGGLAPLAEYQQRYPGHDELVAREYAMFEDGPVSSPSGITLELLTTQHRHNYENIGEIARGGMGAIYHVRDATLRRDLAMKMVLGDGGKIDSSSPESHGPLARRFIEEAQLTAQLDHPGVVPVHELGADEEGHLFFTMKYVKGRTLGEIFTLSREGDASWSRNRVLQILVRVLETLAFAHDKGVVHRDLKPANVMVGDFGEVYVMDWGLAKALGSQDEGSLPALETARTLGEDDGQLTAVGQIVGTPAYMPLEQALGREVTGSVDLYAVGAMLYEYLTGHHPFGAKGKTSSHRDVLVRLLKGAPESVATLAPEVPVELVAVTEKAMARVPADRYPDAQELAADLRRFVEGRVVAAHATGRWVELRKWVGRNRALAASIATALVLLVAGLATTLALNVTARRERATAQHERESAQHESYRAALAAAVLAQENSEFAKARALLEKVPVGRRDWIWRLLAARGHEPVLSIEGRKAWGRVVPAFTAAGRLRTVTQRGVEEWDLADPEPRLLLDFPQGAIGDASLTPDGALLVQLDRDENRRLRGLSILEVESGEKRADIAVSGSRYGVVFGRTRVVGVSDGMLRVWDPRTGAELVSRSVPRKYLPLALTADDRRVATVDPEGALRVLDTRTLLPVPDFVAKSGPFHFAAFCRGDRWLVTGDRGEADGRDFPPEVRVWDVETGASVFPGGTRLPGRIYSLAVAPDGSRIVVATGRAMHVLDPAVGRIESTHRRFERQPVLLAVDPRGRYVAAADGTGWAGVWSLADPNVLTGHASYVYPVAFSPDGRRIVSGGLDGRTGGGGCLRIWDAETGAPVCAVGQAGASIRDLVCTPDGTRIVVSGPDVGKDTEMLVRDTATGEVLTKLPSPCGDLAVHPDSGAVVVVRGGRLERLDPVTGRTWSAPDDSGEGLYLPAWSPDGKRIACLRSASVERIVVCDAESLSPLVTLAGHAKKVWSLRWSPDGRRLVTTSTDDTVRVWDAESGAELALLDASGAHPLSAIFAPDGRYVVSGHRDGRIRIWDLEDREVVAELIGHRDYVYSLALSPDGETLVSGSGDRTVRVWRTRTPETLRRAIRRREVLVAELAPRVQRLFDELEDPAAVVARLGEEPEARRREVALQLALAEAVRRRGP